MDAGQGSVGRRAIVFLIQQDGIGTCCRQPHCVPLHNSDQTAGNVMFVARMHAAVDGFKPNAISIN
ncbi:MAG: hypothetical protein ABS76_31500 [Pelagibacterium sp. SCN 64-44]|nr:MAG: hypothetical protein ABS76_31500 [Pelagibacterium sp. SCN 64-44]